MSKEKLKEDIKTFMDTRVWMTKKVRMQAEARLKLNQIISDILINYYTFFVLVFSVWSLVFNPVSEIEKYITLSTLILSIGLFGIPLLLSLIGFKQKGLQFKESYLKLDNLETELRQLLRTADNKKYVTIIDEFNLLEKKYIDILALSDNHSSIDYESVLISRKNTEISRSLKARYYSKKILKYIFIFLMFSIPLFLFVFVKYLIIVD